jgi:hypothetical protein
LWNCPKYEKKGVKRIIDKQEQWKQFCPRPRISLSSIVVDADAVPKDNLETMLGYS